MPDDRPLSDEAAEYLQLRKEEELLKLRERVLERKANLAKATATRARQEAVAAEEATRHAADIFLVAQMSPMHFQRAACAILQFRRLRHLSCGHTSRFVEHASDFIVHGHHCQPPRCPSSSSTRFEQQRPTPNGRHLRSAGCELRSFWKPADHARALELSKGDC